MFRNNFENCNFINTEITVFTNNALYDDDIVKTNDFSFEGFESTKWEGDSSLEDTHPMVNSIAKNRSDVDSGSRHSMNERIDTFFKQLNDEMNGGVEHRELHEDESCNNNGTPIIKKQESSESDSEIGDSIKNDSELKVLDSAVFNVMYDTLKIVVTVDWAIPLI